MHSLRHPNPEIRKSHTCGRYVPGAIMRLVMHREIAMRANAAATAEVQPAMLGLFSLKEVARALRPVLGPAAPSVETLRRHLREGKLVASGRGKYDQAMMTVADIALRWGAEVARVVAMTAVSYR